MSIRTTQIGNENWVGYSPTISHNRVTQIGNEVWLITIPVPGPTGPPPPAATGPSGVSGDSSCFCPPFTYIQLNTVP